MWLFSTKATGRVRELGPFSTKATGQVLELELASLNVYYLHRENLGYP